MTYRQAITLASNRLGIPNEVMPQIFRRLPEKTFAILDDEITGHDPMTLVRELTKKLRELKLKEHLAKNPGK